MMIITLINSSSLNSVINLLISLHLKLDSSTYLCNERCALIPARKKNNGIFHASMKEWKRLLKIGKNFGSYCGEVSGCTTMNPGGPGLNNTLV